MVKAGYYGSGFHLHEGSLLISGGVSDKSCDEMLDEAYESLKTGVEGEFYIPFGFNNTKKSVRFDCVRCQSLDEIDKYYELAGEGKTFVEMENELQW